MRASPIHRSNDAGHLTLGILFGIVFLSTVVFLASREVRTSEHIATRLISTERGYRRALAQNIAEIRSRESAPAASPFFEDIYTEGRFGTMTIGVTSTIGLNRFFIAQQTALLNGGAPGSPRFPFIDLDQLLSAPRACPAPLPADVGRTPGGRILTPGSLSSAELCQLQPNAVRGGNSFRENIAVPGGTLLESPTPADLVTLATPGFIEAATPLTIRGTAIIVAGGDLFIATLEASKPSMVSLVATTGRIVIGHVSPNLAVRAFGFAGVDLPPDTTLSTAPPLPPLRERLILGIKRGPP